MEIFERLPLELMLKEVKTAFLKKEKSPVAVVRPERRMKVDLEPTPGKEMNWNSLNQGE